MSYFLVIFRIIGVAALSLSTFWNLRYMIAEIHGSSGTRSQVEIAKKMAPGNASYEGMLAGFSDSGVEMRRLLLAAAAASPYDSGYLTALGFEAERREEFKSAELYFLRAFEVDHEYEPRWTIAGYYFRRGNKEEFWHWSEMALQVGRGDMTSLFSLCSEMTGDPSVVLEHIPNRRGLRIAYFTWLVELGRYSDALSIFSSILDGAAPSNKPLLVGFNENLIRAGRFEDAKYVWDKLAGKQMIGVPPHDFSSGNILVNRDFFQPLLNAGFDWRIPEVEGVTVRSAGDQGVEAELTGNQPEFCSLLEQLVILSEGKYALRFRYRTTELAQRSGIYWRIADWTTNQDFPSAPEFLFADSWVDRVQLFDVSAHSRIARVSLNYRRPPGEIRSRGTLLLSSVSLSKDAEAHP